MTLRKIDENMIDDKLTNKVNDVVAKAEELKVSLADKAGKAEVQSLVTNKAETAYVDTSVARKRDLLVPIGLSDASPEFLAAVQNKVGETTFNLLSEPRNGSVTPGKTTFLATGKNKFNYLNVVSGYRVDRDTGKLVASSTSGSSELIEVKPSAMCHLIKPATHVAFYSESLEFISGLNLSFPPFSMTTPSNARYVRFNTLLGDFKTQQFEEGNVSTFYEPYRIIPKDMQYPLIDLNGNTSEYEYLDGKIVKIHEKSNGLTVKTTTLVRVNGEITQVKEETSDLLSVESIIKNNGKITQVNKTITHK